MTPPALQVSIADGNRLPSGGLLACLRRIAQKNIQDPTRIVCKGAKS